MFIGLHIWEAYIRGGDLYTEGVLTGLNFNFFERVLNMYLLLNMSDISIRKFS